jgi:hypothetical protein
MTAPAPATWRTDDPCPVCGTGLHHTDDPARPVTRQDCPLCGWSATWADPPAPPPAAPLLRMEAPGE